MLDDVERLKHYRLANDLTYRQLSDEMGEAGFPLPLRTLHGALTKAGPNLQDRTFHKIREFLATRAAVAAADGNRPQKVGRRRA